MCEGGGGMCEGVEACMREVEVCVRAGWRRVSERVEACA